MVTAKACVGPPGHRSVWLVDGGLEDGLDDATLTIIDARWLGDVLVLRLTCVPDETLRSRGCVASHSLYDSQYKQGPNLT
jgi:hypothetical protein